MGERVAIVLLLVSVLLQRRQIRKREEEWARYWISLQQQAPSWLKCFGGLFAGAGVGAAAPQEERKP